MAPRTLLFSQDPGGGNLLAPAAKRLADAAPGGGLLIVAHPLSEGSLSREGVPFRPLGEIFGELPVPAEKLESWFRAEGFGRLICSLSSTHLDLTNCDLIRAARAAGAPSLGLIDHWKGADRFFDASGAPAYCPDLIGVIDELCARNLERAGIERGRMRIAGHPALERVFRLREERTPPGEAPRILLVSQPQADEGDFMSIFALPCNGRTLLEEAVDRLREAFKPGEAAIGYRPHPKERAFGPLPAGVRLEAGPRGEDVLLRFDLFAGMSSLFLVEARLAGGACVELDIPEVEAFRQEGAMPDWAARRVGAIAELGEGARAAWAAMADSAQSAASGDNPFSGSLERTVDLCLGFIAHGAPAETAAPAK